MADEIPTPKKHNRSKGAPRDAVARREGAALQATIASMVAHRVPLKKIGRAVQRDWKTVRTILGQAETQRMVEDYRLFIKGHALSEAVEIQVDGFKWLKETMQSREPKEFAMVAKGMGDLERIYASASGEGQKAVQVAQINVPGEGVTAEIRALVEALMPPKP